MERIMELEHHWKTIIETVQDGLMIVEPSGQIIAINSAAERLTGFSRNDLVGNTCRVLDCTGCKLNGIESENWCGLFEKGEVRAKNCTIKSKSQRTIHILKSASVMYDRQGKIIGAIEILTDISDSIRQQEKITSLRNTLNLDRGYHDLIGISPVMKRLFELIENVAQTDAPVMILGKSGTGKELTAMAIHEASSRRDQSFIKVNCAALNENLLESELFGHIKGAYTGADRNRIGRFEAAHGGSIFLDEIGDIPLSTQVKLLRVLEDNVIERVGDNRSIPVDVRIITATNRHLEELIADGKFREDLFFRINVFPLTCPSLSQRVDDIPILAQRFIDYAIRKNKKKILGFTPKAMERLLSYQWPGNVRELRNAVDYAMVLCHSGLIDIEHLPPRIVKDADQGDNKITESPFYRREREKLISALLRAEGNQSEAARILGVSRVTIWKRIKKYNVDLNADLAPI
jgi:two-component system response regulator HydG